MTTTARHTAHATIRTRGTGAGSDSSSTTLDIYDTLSDFGLAATHPAVAEAVHTYALHILRSTHPDRDYYTHAEYISALTEVLTPTLPHLKKIIGYTSEIVLDASHHTPLRDHDGRTIDIIADLQGAPIGTLSLQLGDRPLHALLSEAFDEIVDDSISSTDTADIYLDVDRYPPIVSPSDTIYQDQEATDLH